MNVSPLERARHARGWTRAQVEELTKGKIPAVSLERWEKNRSRPRGGNIEILCRLYNSTPQELALGEKHVIIGATMNATSIQEKSPMSEFLRRELLGNPGSRVASLVDLWPRADHHYDVLQSEINKIIFDQQVNLPADLITTASRREVLKSIALLPLQLVFGVAVTNTAGRQQKTDTDTLLKQIAAGLTSAWYLRRSSDLVFVSEISSTYINLLSPLLYASRNAHRCAAALLLSQSFRLKSRLVDILQDDDSAIFYDEEAIRYAKVAESVTEQAIASREMALLYFWREKYRQALPHAEIAYGLAKSTNAHPIILSFTASGLAFCQAASGLSSDAKRSLALARDSFEPTPTLPSLPYTEMILLSSAVSVHQHSGDFGEATHLCQTIVENKDLSPVAYSHQRIKYARIEVSRDDKPREMKVCTGLLSEAIIKARELDAQTLQREAHEVYGMLRLVWPREDEVKKLGRDHFGD